MIFRLIGLDEGGVRHSHANKHVALFASRPDAKLARVNVPSPALSL
jgi:hypothetical protein